MYPEDFIKFVNNLNYYIHCNFKFVKEDGISYPIGQLDDIKIYFTHYNDEEEAENAFNNRKTRINWDNIFVIMTDANGCTLEMIKEYDKIKYPHVIFTHKKIDGVKCTYYCEHDKDGVFHAYRRKMSPYRFYDSFDFVKWFNTGEF